MWQRSLAEQGFTIFPENLANDQVKRLLGDLSQVYLRRGKAGIRHALGRPAVSALAHDRRLLGIALEILGGEAFPFRATLFAKSLDGNWLIPWHQDTALPLQEKHDVAGWGPWSVKEGVIYAHAPGDALGQILALRVHLDDSTPENGPLRVLPGTHNSGVLSDDAIREFAHQITPVSCTVPRGGVLVMRPLLLHSSSKSHTEIARRVLHIEYAAPTALAGGLQLAVARGCA